VKKFSSLLLLYDGTFTSHYTILDDVLRNGNLVTNDDEAM
jgi:hypothetical protein